MCASDATLFHVLIAVNVGVGKLAAFHEKYFHAKQHHAMPTNAITTITSFTFAFLKFYANIKKVCDILLNISNKIRTFTNVITPF